MTDKYVPVEPIPNITSKKKSKIKSAIAVLASGAVIVAPIGYGLFLLNKNTQQTVTDDTFGDEASNEFSPNSLNCIPAAPSYQYYFKKTDSRLEISRPRKDTSYTCARIVAGDSTWDEPRYLSLTATNEVTQKDEGDFNKYTDWLTIPLWQCADIKAETTAPDSLVVETGQSISQSIGLTACNVEVFSDSGDRFELIVQENYKN